MLEFNMHAWYCRKEQSNGYAKEILTVAAGHELWFRQLCQQQEVIPFYYF